jgi:hypothetical protein
MLPALHVKTARYERCSLLAEIATSFASSTAGLEAVLDPDQCPDLAAETDDS